MSILRSVCYQAKQIGKQIGASFELLPHVKAILSSATFQIKTSIKKKMEILVDEEGVRLFVGDYGYRGNELMDLIGSLEKYSFIDAVSLTVDFTCSSEVTEEQVEDVSYDYVTELASLYPNSDLVTFAGTLVTPTRIRYEGGVYHANALTENKLMKILSTR